MDLYDSIKIKSLIFENLSNFNFDEEEKEKMKEILSSNMNKEDISEEEYKKIISFNRLLNLVMKMCKLNE